MLVVILLRILEGLFSCSLHFWVCASLEHAELCLFVPPTAKAFQGFSKVFFLISNIEPFVQVVYISLENGVIPIKFSCLLVPKAVDDTVFDFSSSAGYALFLRGQF